jgi:glycosyltransferase involved in cell wall biosynthesis
MTLYYVPLESYIERYTMQWSAPITGWLERNWIKANVNYKRIDGEESLRKEKPIKAGCVLDAVKRSKFCFSQISRLLTLAEAGELHDDDVIYFDDFWTPGMEALPYAFTLLGVKPKMFAFLHAQSVDEYDFTTKMLPWIRRYESGNGIILDGIFVCCPLLKHLVVDGGIASKEKVFVTGHPFNSEEVMERMSMAYDTFSRHHRIGVDNSKRSNHVIWSSRWDKEKNPEFFLKVAGRVIHKMPETKFIICTSSPSLRSNDQRLLEVLKFAQSIYPENAIVKEGLSKEAYYAELIESKVQFNSAYQDFVAISLLEASVAGCYPIYPNYRSFPETFLYTRDYTYDVWNIDKAANKVLEILGREDLWTHSEIRKRAWIHERYDTSWLRMLKIMGLYDGEVSDPYDISQTENKVQA